jgi:hypothetical protein
MKPYKEKKRLSSSQNIQLATSQIPKNFNGYPLKKCELCGCLHSYPCY